MPKPSPYQTPLSYLVITKLARAFPITFTEVSDLSGNHSIPEIASKGEPGKSYYKTAPNKIPREFREILGSLFRNGFEQAPK